MAGVITDLAGVGLILAISGVVLLAGLVAIPVIVVSVGVGAAAYANQPK
jgi:hypothetical protein